MHQQIVYVMCGLPFAGKSTLARALAARLDLALLEVDQINAERDLAAARGRQPTRREWAQTYREAYRRLDDLLAADRSVVYDAVNFRRFQRDRLRAIAATHGATTRVVWIDLPAPEARARLDRNRRHPSRGDVPDAAFDEVLAGFQPPTPDEQVLRYDGTEPINVWLDRL